MKSIISNEPVCYRCGTPFDLERHHIFSGNGRRQLSEKFGLWVYLCPKHHTFGPEAVHNDKALDLTLRKMGQQAWEDRYGTREDFIKVFGRSWLEE